MLTTRKLLAAGVTLGLLAAGCGSTSDTTTSSTGEAAADGGDSPSSSGTGDATTVTSEPAEPSTSSEGEATSTTAAVSSTAAQATSSTTPQQSTTTTTPGDGGGGGEPAQGSGPIDPGLQPFIDQAVADLMQRQSVAPSQITVESARLVQWRDSAAGCPEKDMQYLQVLTDGSAIELETGGTTYWYHSGGSQGLFLCTSPLRESPFPANE